MTECYLNPLYMAVSCIKLNTDAKLKLITLFLKYGADPNGRCPDDQSKDVNATTSIFYSACVWSERHPFCDGTDRYPALQLLLDAGADPTAENSTGSTPSDYARKKKNKKLLDFLETAEAAVAAKESAALVAALAASAAECSAGRGSSSEITTDSAAALAADDDDGPSAMAASAPVATTALAVPVAVVATAAAGSSSVVSPPAAKWQRRSTRSTPMAERAAKAGVAHLLQPLPLNGGKAAAKAVKKVQTANQQIVSRAEEQLAKGLEPRPGPGNGKRARK